MMDIVIRDLIVVTRNIDAGTVGAIGGRRTRRVGNLKTVDPYIVGLDIEALHHHAALGLKVEQFACTTGGAHLNALVIGAGVDDDGVAAVEGVGGLLNRPPRRSRRSRIRIASRRRYVIGLPRRRAGHY